MKKEEKNSSQYKGFQFPVVATDIAIFTLKQDELHILLIEMKKEPYGGFWALPGGIVQVDESVDDSAKRHLQSKTGVRDVFLEQLYTFGRVDRDPFGRVVSVAYFALIPHDNVHLSTTAEYGGVKWFPVRDMPKLAYDHQDIFDLALGRLRSKLEYSNIAHGLLPEHFTLTELQSVYELILGKKIDKRNFRKKILHDNWVEPTRKFATGAKARPAKLYRFKDKGMRYFN